MSVEGRPRHRVARAAGAVPAWLLVVLVLALVAAALVAITRWIA